LTNRKNRPQNVADEGVGGTTSADGAASFAQVLARHPNAQMFLVMYGTNDQSLNRPSGAGLSPGQAGYAGSFKDYMQQIVTAVNNAGKKIALAHAPVVLENCNGTCALFFNPNDTSNTLIRQYNQAIDQIVANTANHITVTPPDFYGYFSQNWQTQYSDVLHPNGVGYQSMANLWNAALP
jgi:lysophospholipase L1-like esterase